MRALRDRRLDRHARASWPASACSSSATCSVSLQPGGADVKTARHLHRGPRSSRWCSSAAPSAGASCAPTRSPRAPSCSSASTSCARNEAVAEERARIARELHDLVAHNVSVMVVQAGAERHALGAEQASTREALASIEQAGRQALVEARRLLGHAAAQRRRRGARAAAQRRAASTCSSSRSSGRGCRSRSPSRASGCRCPAGVDLCAYRIVQEGLTNALKHAGPAHAEVVLRYAPRALDVEVRDDGRGPSRSGNGDGAGHGLIGMRERVALYGGAPADRRARRRRLRDPRAPAAGVSTRVLIADDQALVRAGFRKLLESAPGHRGGGRGGRRPRGRRPGAAPAPDRSSSWTSACRAWTASRRRAG